MLFDGEGRVTGANPAMLEMAGLPRDGFVPGSIRWRDFSEPAEPAEERRLRQELLTQGRIGPFERRLKRQGGGTVPVLVSAARIDEGQDEYVAFLVDQTAQKAADAHRDLLLSELNHRVKNSLATIQAMASHTLRNSRDMESFGKTFIGRLHAIAAAHEILTGTNGNGAGRVSLRELIARQVGPYARLDGQVRLEGADVRLAADPGHALGLILHELTTNAAKYGALGSEAGRVTIRWQVEKPVDSGPRLGLEWIEEGGPEVAPPTRKGFGSRLIESTLSHSLGGHAEMHYDPQGLRVRLEVPVEEDDERSREPDGADHPGGRG
jgi:two-component system CheB/CheR fusion protein